MGFIERKLQELGEFFSKDILSFSILICLGVFLVNHLASANSSVKSSNTNITKLKSKKYIDNESSGSLSQQIKFHNDPTIKNWQINIGLSVAQKAISDGSQKDQNNNEYNFNSETSIKFSNDMSLKSIFGYSTYNKNELQNDFSDLLMSLYLFKSKFNSNINFSPYLTTTIPISKDSSQRQQMNLGYGLGASLSNQSRLLSGFFSIAGGISLQKYSHKYDTSLNNTINTSHSSNQQVSTGWEYKQIGLTLLFRHINSWNYNGTMRESFLHLQEISWSATKNLSFSGGHSNSGNVLSPNQEDIQIRLIDDNSSTLFLSTNYIF